MPGYVFIVARRGPKRKSTWNVSTFLLRRANADFLPRKEEADYLSQNGFGECQDKSLSNVRCALCSKNLQALLCIFPNI